MTSHLATSHIQVSGTSLCVSTRARAIASKLIPGICVGKSVCSLLTWPAHSLFSLAGNVASFVHGSLCAGVVACYPSLQMHAMRDARGLHSDLKRTASLELLHQRQVEAEEGQSSLAAPDTGLGSDLSTVKSRFLGRKYSGGGCCLHNLAVSGPSSSIWVRCMACVHGCAKKASPAVDTDNGMAGARAVADCCMYVACTADRLVGRGLLMSHTTVAPASSCYTAAGVTRDLSRVVKTCPACT